MLVQINNKMFNKEKLSDVYGIVESIEPLNKRKLVATYKVVLKLDLPTLYIQIWESDDNKFFSQPNYWFRYDNSITPYNFAPEFTDTIEGAIEEIIERGYNDNYDKIEYEINSAFYEYIGAPIPKTLN